MNPTYRSYESAETFAFADGIKMKLLMSGSETNGLQEIFEDIAEPGVGPGRHIHHKQDETFIFLEGTFDVEIDGKLHRMKKGDVALVPKGTVHAWKNVGTNKGRLIYIFTPSLNVEEMFRELNEAWIKGKLTEENIVQIMHKYPEQEMVGPPLKARFEMH
ncbi:MAG: cupin domain-containing protein [Cyclobacteriaceae bacterium]